MKKRRHLSTLKGVYENQRAVTSDKRVFLLTRSSFAGQQRFASHSWSGDVVIRWDIFRNQISVGLRMLKNRKFNIVIVTRGKAAGDMETTVFDKVVSYHGKQVIVKF